MAAAFGWMTGKRESANQKGSQNLLIRGKCQSKRVAPFVDLTVDDIGVTGPNRGRDSFTTATGPTWARSVADAGCP